MFNRNLLKKLYLALSMLSVMSFSVAVNAHEFWLEPLNFKVKQGENIEAHIKVGQDLEGDTYAFFPALFDRFDVTVNGKKRTLKYRFAQKPAVDEPTTEDALHILTHQSRPSKLVYEDPAKFESFLKAEGIEWVLKAHEERGLSTEGITELYKRFAKSLVKVGSGKGQDNNTGMRFEWVVLTNPYQESALKTVTAQLFFEDKPFADSTVNVFIKRDAKVEKIQLKTDADGKVEIPVADGGLFLVNAVHMVIPDETDGDTKDAVWLSLWASTTFMID